MRTLPVAVISFACGLLAWSCCCRLAAAGSRPDPFRPEQHRPATATDDARMVGRGGWGMAVTTPCNPGFKNLASLYRLRHLVLKFTGYGDKMESRIPGATRMNSRAYLRTSAWPGPCSRTVALTAGFQVYRSTQYHTFVDTTWGRSGSDPSAATTSSTGRATASGSPWAGPWKLFPACRSAARSTSRADR